jgi:hypothetical protein
MKSIEDIEKEEKAREIFMESSKFRGGDWKPFFGINNYQKRNENTPLRYCGSNFATLSVITLFECYALVQAIGYVCDKIFQ